MDIWPGLAWHVYHLFTEDLELTESGANAEGRDDDRLGQLPAPHPAIPSHVRVRGGPEEKPAAGEDSFVRSPNRRQIEGSHSPPHPPSLAGYPATTELSAIPTDFPTTYTSGLNNHFWGHGWRAVIPNCWGPFLSLLIFVMQNQVRIAVSLKGSSPQKVRSLKSHILDSNGVWYSY